MRNYRVQPNLNAKREKIAIKEFYNVVLSTGLASWGIREDLGINCEDISSAFVMYKLACLFHGVTITYSIDGYKSVWCVILRDRETNETITIYDWKGGVGFGECQDSSEKTIENLREFIKLYILGKCPHPYDNVIAGSVA